jgi:BirA family biotin operon repressor/biotin-[acetyl-CoA-carboxylase] ligase
MAVSLPDGVDRRALLALLADGEVRSATWLARQLQSTRAQVGQGVERLRALGVEIAAPTRRGYCLPRAVELLDAGRIRAALGEGYQHRLRRLEVLLEVDSTNTRLLQLPPPPWDCVDALLSEIQSAGRGRRGREWLSPFGGSIAMSVSRPFRAAERANPTLSLAVGVAVARALVRMGARGIRLKWPNDIWFADRKMGGVLIELRTETGGPAHVVTGVGLNLSLPSETRREIEASGTRVAALAEACTAPVPRNELAAALLEELLSMLADFERRGFAPFRDEWSALDVLGGRAARVLTGDGAVEGVARGVDAEGALLLDCGSQRQRFVSGEVSLRLGDA